MTRDQALLFILFAAIMGLSLWGRIRHDLVAAVGLLSAVVLGLVPEQSAFSGFSNPAVMIVALVLVASRAFENSGALGLPTRLITANKKRSAGAHIAMIGGIAAALSAVINNVAALAMLMPIDVEAARKTGRPPGQTLMPLAFATILGGMVTLIGTPPNIIASTIREQQLGKPYSMFDFSPVGGAVAIFGVLFVALIGWRLVPRRKDQPAEIDPSSFFAELLVPEDSKLLDSVGADLDQQAEDADVRVVGLVRNGRRYRKIRAMTIRAGDLLVVEGATDGIASFIKSANLQRAEAEKDEPDKSKKKDDAENGGELQEADRPEIVEAVVRADSYLIGWSAASIGLRRRFGITLLGIARAGRLSREQVSQRTIDAGDELLISGGSASSLATLDQLGLVAVNRISVARFKPINAALAVALFAGAIAVATLGYLSFTVAIAIVIAAYAALGLVPAREFYTSIEWSVVVMLACLLPLGMAFERVGGTALIANTIADITQGHSPVLALLLIMVATMTLSDVLNNVATIVVTGPIAIDLAQRLHVNPDTFLMGVAIAASCAFLTPIGHKNNTLIMGPGGFRFSDYWRMGLPLEIVVLVVSIPTLLIFWRL